MHYFEKLPSQIHECYSVDSSPEPQSPSSIKAQLGSESADAVPQANESQRQLTIVPHYRPATTEGTAGWITERTASMAPEGHVGPPSPTPLEFSGHFVSVTLQWTEPIPQNKGRTKFKKMENTKSDHIIVDGAERVDFLADILQLHDLEKQFQPNRDKGPSFRMWWKGSSGGAGRAATIETDKEFANAVGQILKKTTKVNVGVSFNTDEMGAFRILRRGAPWDEGSANTADTEDLRASKVPRIDGYAPDMQLNGAHILQLKKAHVCEEHLGEHGEPGQCYVAPSGSHIRLNLRRLAIWGAAMGAGEATKYTPPNVAEFDGLRDAVTATGRSRGRSGPNAASSSSTAPPTAPPDFSAMFQMAAMVPFMASLTQQATAAATPRTAIVLPTTPHRPRPITTTPFSPTPAVDDELHACLIDFRRSGGIDILAREGHLDSVDYSPDVVQDAELSRLQELTDLTEGKSIKFRAFCRAWCVRLAEKRQVGE